MRRCEEETQVPKVARHYFDKNDDDCKDYDDEYPHNFDDNDDKVDIYKEVKRVGR